MQLSEDKAKEVLDFLVHKVNPDVSWNIINWFDKFALQVQFQDGSGITRMGFFRRSDNNMICQSCSSSYICTLNTLIDEASQCSIIYVFKNVEYEIIHKMTTLEQILLDMDLSANV